MVGLGDLRRRHQHVAAVALHQRAAELPGDPVAHRGADPRAGRRGHDDERDVEASLRGPVGGGGDHDLGGDRDGRALEDHHDEDAEVAPLEDEVHPDGEKVVDRIGHAAGDCSC